jgi:hypothetical protein
MLERKTSEQRRPMASVRDTPVMVSAARLKDEMRHSRSTVNTPSDMLSRMASVGVGAVALFLGGFIALRGAGLAGGFVVRQTSHIRPLAGMVEKR